MGDDHGKETQEPATGSGDYTGTEDRKAQESEALQGGNAETDGSIRRAEGAVHCLYPKRQGLRSTSPICRFLPIKTYWRRWNGSLPTPSAAAPLCEDCRAAISPRLAFRSMTESISSTPTPRFGSSPISQHSTTLPR